MSERIVKYISTALLSASLVLTPSFQKESCYTNGYFDLRKCKDFRNVSAEILNNGYYNLSGVFEPYLPSYELQYLNAGNYLEGKVYRTNTEYALWRKDILAPKWNLNSSDYTGTISLGTNAYINTAIYIENLETGIIQGPLLDIEPLAPVHMRDYFCQGAIADIDTQTFKNLFPNESGAGNARIIIQASTDLTKPNFNTGEQFVNLAETWLQKDKWHC